MRKLTYVLTFLLGLILIGACEKKDSEVPVDPQNPSEPMAVLNLDELSESDLLKSSGGEFYLKLYSSADWTAEVVPVEAQWLSLDRNAGKAGEHTIVMTTAENGSGEERSAELFLHNALDEQISVRIQQRSSGLKVVAPEFPVNCLGGEIGVQLTASENIQVKVTDASWLTPVGFRENVYVFQAAENTSTDFRSAEVEFSNTSTGDMVTVTLGQDAYIDWVKDEFYKRSLMMKFTSTTCSNCPAFSSSIAKAQEEYPDRIVTYSVYDVQSENEIRFLPTDMFNYYKGYINFFPTGIQDGRASFGNAVPYQGIVDLAEEAVETLPAKCTADISSALEDNRLKVNLKVYCKQADRYKVAIALIENDFVCMQNSPAGYVMDFVHDHVLRGFLTAEEGDELLMEHSGIKELSYEYEIPSKVSDVANCELILYFFSPIEQNTTALDYKEMKILKLKEYVDNAIPFSLNDERLRK